MSTERSTAGEHLYKATWTDPATGKTVQSRAWYGWYYDPAGKQVRRSTKCSDKDAARKVLRGWEKRSADPDGASKAEATLKDAFDLLQKATLARVTAKNPSRSIDTVSFHAKQALGWYLFAGMRVAKVSGDPKSLARERKRELRQLGQSFPLEQVGPGFVDSFLDWRRASGRVGESTIGKDLSVLRPAMRCALRAGKWGGSLEQTFPRHELAYEPGDRWLTLDELALLKAEMEAHRFAVVAFAYALGAEPRACKRALRVDLDDETARFIHVRGTKKKTRDRWVPICFDWQRELLAFVREHADGEGAYLFSPWNNQRRVLTEACERAGIASATLTSMRHSFAHQCKNAGVRQEDLAVAMGHTDTKMLDRIYGKASTPLELSKRFEAAIQVQRVATLTVIEGGKATGGGAKSA